MKYTYITLIAFLSIALSCQKRESKTPKEVSLNQPLKTVQTSYETASTLISGDENNPSINAAYNTNEINIKVSDSAVLVSYLKKFDNQNDYYLELHFNSEYSDSLWSLLDQSKSEVIYQKEEQQRVAVPDSIIKAHFSTIGIDTLFLINANQKIYDTIYRNRFEFYEASIEAYYIASYSLDGDHDESIVAISSNSVIEKIIKNSPEKHQDPSVGKRNKASIVKNYDELFSESTLIHNTDTISIISTGIYSKNIYSVYLVKNGAVKDTITNNYLALKTIEPVPFATNDELTYIYSGFQPESDAYWNGLLGIDIKNWKLNLYTTNRLERPLKYDKRAIDPQNTQ